VSDIARASMPVLDTTHGMPFPHHLPPFCRPLLPPGSGSAGAAPRTDGKASGGVHGDEGLRSSPPGDGSVAVGGSPVPAIPTAHVLVVEDDPTNRRLVARMLGRIGATCDTLEDGDEVLQRLRETGQMPGGSLAVLHAAARPPYDLVLMDIMMQRSNGAHVTRDLRLVGATLPIFPMTANTSTSDVVLYRSCGMADYVIAKPFSVEALRKTIALAAAMNAAVGGGGGGGRSSSGGPASGATLDRVASSHSGLSGAAGGGGGGGGTAR